MSLRGVMRLLRYVLSPVCSSNAGTKKVATNSDANRLMMRTSENSLKVTFCLSPTKNTRESAPTVVSVAASMGMKALMFLR